MPTATDRDFLDMPVSDIRRIGHPSGPDHHVVVLQEPEGAGACRSGSAWRTPLNWPFASWATDLNSPGRSARI
jgi:hypothetical protein